MEFVVGKKLKLEKKAVGLQLADGEESVYVTGSFKAVDALLRIEGVGDIPIQDGYVEVEPDSEVTVVQVDPLVLQGKVFYPRTVNFEEGYGAEAIEIAESLFGVDLSLIEKYEIVHMLKWNIEVGRDIKEDLIQRVENCFTEYQGSHNGYQSWTHDREFFALLLAGKPEVLNILDAEELTLTVGKDERWNHLILLVNGVEFSSWYQQNATPNKAAFKEDAPSTGKSGLGSLFANAAGDNAKQFK